MSDFNWDSIFGGGWTSNYLNPTQQFSQQAVQGAQGFMNGPTPPNLQQAAIDQSAQQQQLIEGQTQANRPNQVDQFGNTLNWTKDAQGNWTQSVNLSPEQQARQQQHNAFAGNLMGAAQSRMGQGLDFSGLPGVSSGDEARNRAEGALFDRMNARLEPMWAKRGEALRTQLINQGLDPSSEAAKNANSDFNTARNDAYSSAMNDAITHGGTEASRIFGMDFSRRGQAGNELMMGHQAGLQNLGAAGGIFGMTGPQSPQFAPFMGAGVAQAPNLLGASATQAGLNNDRWKNQTGMVTDGIGGLFNLGGSLV